MSSNDVQSLIDDVLAGDKTGLARAISLVEDREEGFRDVLKGVYPETGSSRIIGVTGSPGSGKSTLVNGLVGEFSNTYDRIGVIAVDPSSPYSGGSILGDRIRFEAPDVGEDVFFRSMSARGLQGGLAAATGDAIRLLDAAGYDPIIVETVGAGQNEIDIVRTADTVLVVTMPSSGDDVQMLKAGILEIGDIFVVNKSDLEGSDQTALDLEQMIRRSEGQREEGSANWKPEVINTVATETKNIGQVREAIDRHHEFLETSDQLKERQITRCADEITRLIDETVQDRIQRKLEENGGLRSFARRVRDGDSDPYTVSETIVKDIGLTTGE